MSPVLSRRIVRELIDELKELWPEGTHRQRVLIDALGAALRLRSKGSEAMARKAARRAGQVVEMGAIRDAVLMRANGRCEACGWAVEDGQVDHFFGGSGRRTELQSSTTCWLLCPHCHREKTDNQPGAAAWLKAFIAHCHRQEPFLGYGSAVMLAQARLDSLVLMDQVEELRKFKETI